MSHPVPNSYMIVATSKGILSRIGESEMKRQANDIMTNAVDSHFTHIANGRIRHICHITYTLADSISARNIMKNNLIVE